MRKTHGSRQEGLATHAGPESCAVGRKAEGEALTGGRTGREMEPRNFHNSGTPTLFSEAEGNTGRLARARGDGVPRGQRPRACAASALRENREVPYPPEDRMSGCEGKSEDLSPR